MSPRIPQPNYTQAPNVLLDRLLPEITSLAELKVTLVVVRRTIGYHEDERRISLTELEQRTGLSRRSCIDGVKAGLERGTLERRIEGEKGAEQSFYALNLASEDSSPGLVNDLHQDQCSIFTSAGEESSLAPIEKENSERNTPMVPLASEGDAIKWGQVLDELRTVVPETTFDLYIAHLELTARRGDELVLQAPDHIAAWLRSERFKPLIEETAARHFGPAVTVSIAVSETERARRDREQLLASPQRTVRERRRRRA